jgi:probable HAF family extracellular repeat protein
MPLLAFVRKLPWSRPRAGQHSLFLRPRLETLEHRCLLTSYTITDLGVVSNGIYSYAEAINNEGQIVGYSAVGGSSYHDPFLYQNGQMTDLGLLPREYGGTAIAINDAGVAVGDQYRVNPSKHLAVIYNTDGTMTTVPPLGGNSSRFFGINNAGDAVGFSETAQSIPPHAVLYTGGELIDLGTLPGDLFSWAYGINDDGVIVGKSGGGDINHAFIYQDGLMCDLGTLGGSNAVADAISNNGLIAGYSSPDDASSYHAFLLTPQDGMIDLGTLPGADASYAYGLNSLGQVVGASTSASGSAAFVYQDGQMVDLNSVVDNGGNWTLLSATGINDSGVIVGYGDVVLSVGVRVHGFMLTPNDGGGGVRVSARVSTESDPVFVQAPEGSLFPIDNPILSVGRTIAFASLVQGHDVITPASIPGPKLNPSEDSKSTPIQGNVDVTPESAVFTDQLASPIPFALG